MTEHDPEVGRAQAPGGDDVFPFLEREHLGSDDADHPGPADESDHEQQAGESRAELDVEEVPGQRLRVEVDGAAVEEPGDRDGQQDGRKAQAHLGETQDGTSQPSAAVAGDEAEGDSDSGRREDAPAADGHGDAGAVKHAAEDVAAMGVGAEGKGTSRGKRESLGIEPMWML